MTNPDTAAVMPVLARLQDCPRREPMKLHRWLDLHREEIRLLLAHKPPRVVADLLGIERGDFVRWMERGEIA